MTLADVRAYALSLPGVVEAPHHTYTSFRVAERIFVTVPPEGDRVHVMIDAAAGEGVPGCSPLPWGQRIVGVRAELATTPDDALRQLVADAWAARAPRRLVKLRSTR